MKKISSRAYLPDQDHVIRHVPWKRLQKDEDGNILGFLPQAFALRPTEESISVSWLEYFEGNREAKIKKSVQELRAVRKTSKKSAFGIGNVGTIKEICKKSGKVVKIVYAPSKGISSHSEIRHIPKDDLLLLQDLATHAFLELVHNDDIEE